MKNLCLKSFFLLAALMTVHFVASAQIKLIENTAVAKSESFSPYAHIQVAVKDSITNEPLDGAFVIIASIKDTLKSVSDEKGRCSFRLESQPDSIDLITSYLGYKSRTDRLASPKAFSGGLLVELWMQEDPFQLNSIIVKGDAVAMVMRGDTTVFNAAAFTTRTGDALRELLKKFPGVDVLENEVLYQGKKIDRIVFNGNNMFGKDMKSAMDMVLADEVKSISLYEKTAPDAPTSDPDEKKERVMDVRTKKPFESLGQLKIDSGIGIYTARNNTGNYNFNAAGGLSVGRFVTEGKTRVLFSVGGGHNSQNYQASSNASSSPEDAFLSSLIVGRDIPSKGGWEQRLTLSYQNRRKSGGSLKTFSPSAIWKERRDSTESMNGNSLKSVGYVGNAFFRKDGSVIRFNGVFNFSGSTINDRILSSSLTDGTKRGYDRQSCDSSQNISFSVRAIWQRKFRNRTSVNVSFNFDGKFHNGHGKRIDTTANTISREWLTKNSNGRSLLPALQIDLTRKLSSKSRLAFFVGSSYHNGCETSLYTNVFDGKQDVNNTYDYIRNNLETKLTAGYRYGSLTNLYFLVNIGVKHILNMRTERIGNLPDWSKNYLRPVVDANLSHSSSGNKFILKYSESETVPSSKELRNVIDDRNPFCLITGNPELKLPVKRTVTLSYDMTFPSKSIVLSLKSDGSLFSNAMVSKTSYFTKNTFLEEYAYTASAGSALVHPVNVNGKFFSYSSVDYKQYFGKIKSTFGTQLSWNIAGTPFFISEAEHYNLDNQISFSLSFDHNSELLTLGVIPRVTFGNLRCDGTKVYDYLSAGGSGEMVLRLFDCVEMFCRVDGERMFSTRLDAAYANFSLDLKLSWLFGKDRRCRLEVYCNDVTNKASGITNIALDDYSLKSWQNYLGRNLGLYFIYVFSRR